MLTLRQERIRRGWTQHHVAVLTGIAMTDISAIERGARRAGPRWRGRIATAFDMPEKVLFSPAEQGESAEAGV